MKILLIKLGARGDVLRTTGVLPPLKEKHKDARIWWLADENSLEIIKDNPYLSNTVVFSEEKFSGLLEELRNEKFDLVINLEESAYAARLASQMDGEKMGFIWEKGTIYPSPAAEEYWKMSLLGPKPENDALKKKNTRTYQELIKRMMNLQAEIARPIVSLNGETEWFVSDFLLKKGVSEEEKLIGINFGSGARWPTKRLPLKKVEKILENRRYKTIVFGGEDEEEEILYLKSRYPETVFASSLPFKEFASLIARCSVLITTDTLALHVALALGTRVVALFGPTSSSEIELFGLGEKLVAPVKCVCCYKRKCSNEPFCMETFDYPRVIEIAQQML